MAKVDFHELLSQQIAIRNNELPEGAKPFVMPNRELNPDEGILFADHENANNRRVSERMARDRAAIEAEGVDVKPPVYTGTTGEAVSDAQREVKAKTGDGAGTESRDMLTAHAVAAQLAQDAAPKGVGKDAKANPQPLFSSSAATTTTPVAAGPSVGNGAGDTPAATEWKANG